MSIHAAMKYLDGIAQGKFDTSALSAAQGSLNLDPVLALAAQEGFVFSAQDLRRAYIQRQRLMMFRHNHDT
ncbi:hypothetical protein KUL25_21130 [Rhodobacteraceae bacterium N5(2021)]|uniref:Nif11 domain-containing protein n=1 Tax=Gymnodinialimonas phycosphaerae TaxID=2841589 RepID=A0A975TV19_9RHOB|nr:hypothetical protein [Gymnodinialimonas phycosphaerae]MBY4895273.1 hypothetical protein [Gymnodinialimonas phycosphaerae]